MPDIPWTKSNEHTDMADTYIEEETSANAIKPSLIATIHAHNETQVAWYEEECNKISSTANLRHTAIINSSI